MFQRIGEPLAYILWNMYTTFRQTYMNYTIFILIKYCIHNSILVWSEKNIQIFVNWINCTLVCLFSAMSTPSTPLVTPKSTAYYITQSNDYFILFYCWLIVTFIYSFCTGPPTGTAFPISANSGSSKPLLSSISDRIN